MSPHLFNLCSEMVIIEIEEVPERQKMNGKFVNNLRYADDTVPIATSAQGPQRLFDIILLSNDSFDLSVNAEKTKCTCMSVSNFAPELESKCASKQINEVIE